MRIYLRPDFMCVYSDYSFRFSDLKMIKAETPGSGWGFLFIFARQTKL